MTVTPRIAGLIPRGPAPRPRRVAIVGAGILGLCAAWALARRGHTVTVLEAGALPNPAASSHDEGRIFRHAYGTMEGYAALMPMAGAAWRTLFAETGADRFVPCRAVYALRAEGPWEDAVRRTQAAAGLHVSLLDGRALDGIPVLGRDGVRRAVEVAGSGILLARRILEDLIVLLPRLGVTLRGGAAVQDIAGGTLRLTDGERITADAVIVAAGAWIPRLLPEVAAAAGLRVSLQTVAYLESPPDLAPAWEGAPLLLCRLPEHPTGGVYVLPPRAGTALKIGDYDTSAPGAPGAAPDASRQAALLDAGRIAIAGFDRHRVLALRHCLYTMAPEDRFVLRLVEEGTWLASACSGHGFKLAPLMALGLAAAIEGRVAPDQLAPWAAGREPAPSPAPGAA